MCKYTIIFQKYFKIIFVGIITDIYLYIVCPDIVYYLNPFSKH